MIAANSVAISETVCLRQGHHIQLFVDRNVTSHLICIHCGLTQEEIRQGKNPQERAKEATA